MIKIIALKKIFNNWRMNIDKISSNSISGLSQRKSGHNLTVEFFGKKPEIELIKKCIVP